MNPVGKQLNQWGRTAPWVNRIQKGRSEELEGQFPAFPLGFGQCHLSAFALQRTYQVYRLTYAARITEQGERDSGCSASQQEHQHGDTVTTEPLTTELLLLILPVPAVAGSVTDVAGRDAGSSVITQEACPVVGGCTEAGH